MSMSNYIDTDILLDDLLEGRCESDILQKVRQAIIDEVIGLDGIDIVRCKECRYFSVVSDEEEGTNYYMCGVWSNATDEDAFCSYGKRKGTSDD